MKAWLLLGLGVWVSVFGIEENAVHYFQGRHLITSYAGCDQQALSNVARLRQVMHEAVIECGAQELGSLDHVFEGDGMTMVIMLSESHASIHTYPEYGACFVDLFTCGDKCSNEKFDAHLRAYLKPTEVNQKVLVRHKGIEEPVLQGAISCSAHAK